MGVIKKTYITYLEISVSSYARGQQITAQDLDDEDFSLVIDKSNYFAFN